MNTPNVDDYERRNMCVESPLLIDCDDILVIVNVVCLMRLIAIFRHH